MPIKTLIKTSEYHDSVSLMLTARELAKVAGVADAAVVMATEANKGILKEAGMLTPEAQAASPNDLVIAVRAKDDLPDPQTVLSQALVEAEHLLQKKQETGESTTYRPRTLRGAVKANPSANVAVISVAGRYATTEAWDALHHGLHVLLFSDNVSLEDEIALKRYAADHGLLLMGPGAGTAIINGVALGFANVIPPGPVGIVSAAGTGLQEVSTLLAKQGVGITQGIGTGGRDLKEAVGGIMMLEGLKALQDDPTSQVIVLVSKPPAPEIAARVIEQVRQSNKPTVICFLGGEADTRPLHNIHWAYTLEEASNQAARLADSQVTVGESSYDRVPTQKLRNQLAHGQRFIRGLFSGGTLCYEAQVIFNDMQMGVVFSNAPLFEGNKLPDSNHSFRHSVVDLGEEEFTVGRPHPMIDNDLRIRRLMQEAADPKTAVILLDVVLGYGAHPDPAAELGPAIRKAKQFAEQGGRGLLVIASVTGTEGDPQGLSRQSQLLEDAGAIVCPSNAAAARLSASVVEGL